jgi:hypothetical protein
VARFPDPRLDALGTVASIVGAANAAELAQRLTESVRDEFGATWVAFVRGDVVVASAGESVPSESVLVALAAGTTASPAVASGEGGPEDLAIAPLSTHGSVLMVGRDGHPFRKRERHQLLALASIADQLPAISA